MPPAARVGEMSASIIRPDVQRMLDNPGVYITGGEGSPLTVIMVSMGGKIYSTQLDRELSLDGFLDGFVIKSGPHQ